MMHSFFWFDADPVVHCPLQTLFAAQTAIWEANVPVEALACCL